MSDPAPAVETPREWGRGRLCLVIADRPAALEPVRAALVAAGFTAETVTGEPEALRAMGQRSYVAAFATHRLGAAAIGSVLERAAQRYPEVPVLLVGSSEKIQDVVDAVQQGAADYIPTPVQEAFLLARLRRALEHGDSRNAGGEILGLVGASPALRKVFATIEKIARYRTNVLILGESGTGKELVARAIHARGPRRQHLFVPINCATLGREILENELFGHERGAFTGADERKKGLFELADGGTLFLDEIGEMDPSTQAKLLRVLERNEFRRVGGMEKVKVDLSVVAATNRPIDEAIAAGKFREDLYWRLKVVTIVVPRLRERKEDIPALVDAFIADFNRRAGGKIAGIAPPALRRLMEYDWPGNVRELKNTIESAAVLASGETLSLESVADILGVPPRSSTERPADIRIPLDATLAQAEQRIIEAQLARLGNRSEVARTLGIGLRTLYTKLRGYRAKRRT